MGEARRKGNKEERKAAAIRRNKEQLLKLIGEPDERNATALRAGIAPFFARLGCGEWSARREQIFNRLKSVTNGTELAEAKPIRVRTDEIGWYLFLYKQALNDPLCIDISQASRALPFFVGIGERWRYAQRVNGLDRKIDDVLNHYKTEPDGLIFEILVALSYAANGWDVECLAERPPLKSPDLLVRKGDLEFYIECKRQSRSASYAEKERLEFLRLWDAASGVLIANRQWIWLKGVFHVELSNLATDFLAQVLQKVLPIGSQETLIHDSTEATIHARLVDRRAVERHFEKFRVKTNSPMLTTLLGGDWAPPNSAVTIAHAVKVGHVVGCDPKVLGTYVEEIGWASGMTREVDAEISIDKKARDIKNLLADAVSQVPNDRPSIIHIAAETLDGAEVEVRRTKKVMISVPTFIVDKPVLGIRFHRFQANQTVDKLWEFDESVTKFQVDGVALDIPSRIVVPDDVQMVPGGHWEIYP